MSAGPSTPDDGEALRARIQAFLREAHGAAVEVTGLRPLPGGACQENLLVELRLGGVGDAPRERLVLRSDAARSLPFSLDRDAEAEVIRAAVAARVKTPEVRWLAPGLVRPGAKAYFLAFAEGEAVGRKVVASPALAAARAGLGGELARELARIHSITPDSAPALARRLRGAEEDPVTAALDGVRSLLAGLPTHRPALLLALRWLEAHRPAPGPVVLVHGDFRTGNFLVTPKGLSAILDWEFAHFGSPGEDLAWIALRDWRFGELRRPVGGFSDRESFYAAYEAASGRGLDRATLHYWEVLGNVRWAAGSAYQGERYLCGEERDLELLAVARRSSEMEFEALRLIGKGPFAGPQGAAHA